MGRDLSEGIESAFLERVDFLVIALTGRTGSGCSTTASALASSFSNLTTSDAELSAVERRKHQICREFASKHWIPFKTISVSTVIFSFLLDAAPEEIERLLTSQKLERLSTEILSLREELRADSTFLPFERLAIGNDREASTAAWEFYTGPLSRSSVKVRSLLSGKYAPLFQLLGDNVRRSGSAVSEKVDPTKLFCLMRRVKRLAKASYAWDRLNGVGSTRVAIDAIRNPLELVYLRDQFAAFFAIAITADDEDRRARLTDRGLNKRDVETLDTREYSKKSLTSYDNFVSQNLQECIQKADLFLSNPGKPAGIELNKQIVHRQILRYVALMARPGLVTPTSDERCMQLAFVAKLNSGCISRQVGAAVTDSAASIKAVGWNDVPKGQVPCALRDAHVVLNSQDSDAFSEYESNNKEFRTLLKKRVANAGHLRTARGMHCPYCFKDVYNELKGEKNQVHTRSLHAEENAFLQLAKYGNSGIAGGALYTTASPCELCSKKAFQLGIREIVYVDPYPGISSNHVLKSGTKELRPHLRLFSGAVGNAYHRLYEPLLPIKDEYYARLGDDPEPTLI